MKNLIIFGIGEQAEIAYYYFKKETEFRISTFVVDQEYIKKETFIDHIPVCSTETVLEKYPPENCIIFIAIGYSNLNKLRKEKYNLFKEKGYAFASFISNKAINYAKSIGENCFILENNVLQPFVEIGNNVTLWSGNHIGHHSIIEENCFITSQVVISGGCKIGKETFIGVNSTIRDHLVIGKSNVIGAGSLILKNTNDNEVYVEKSTELSRVPSNRLRGI
jgi:sugar O-acyltransferase (sialic acid O-acetyltransferase NeuD family)